MSEAMFPIETMHFYIQPANEMKLWGEDWTISLKTGKNKVRERDSGDGKLAGTETADQQESAGKETADNAETDVTTYENAVGRLRFEHALYHGELELSLELDPTYDTSGYNAEIYFAMARFVFRFKDVKEISTVCRHEDDHHVRALEKAGYVRRETKDGRDHYSMKKQQTGWTGLYLIIGMCAGFIIGILIGNLKIGTLAGVLIGAIIGYLMDKQAPKNPASDNRPPA